MMQWINRIQITTRLKGHVSVCAYQTSQSEVNSAVNKEK